MTNFTRRALVQGGIAAAGTALLPGISSGQAAARKTIRIAGADLVSYDPVVTAQYTTWQVASVVYDTLFGLDAQERPQPQMVGKFGLSVDKLTWTFELRDGLRHHDGTELTSADVVPSLRRFNAGALSVPAFNERLKDISAKDKKTFVIQLREPFGLLPDMLASNVFMMRKREAETDAKTKIDALVGSGPFKFNMAESKTGTQYVFDRNSDYVSRKEPPSGMAGGKVPKIDRLVFLNLPDQATATAAVRAGEVDFFENPPIDMLDELSQDRNVKIDVINIPGMLGYIRLNAAAAPFNNEKCRQAMLYIINQVDHLKANFSNPKYFKPCAALFGCGTALENDANTGWFKSGPNYERAKQLLKEGGYDGRPVVILQGSDWSVSRNVSDIVAQEMRKAGMNVKMEAIDWAGLMQRRASKAPSDQGGWSMHVSASPSPTPVAFLGSFFAANGEKGWFGWPSDAKHEELRQKWLAADSLEERKVLAREIQDNWWKFAPMPQIGTWYQPVLMRSNITPPMKSPFPWFRAWWTADKA